MKRLSFESGVVQRWSDA